MGGGPAPDPFDRLMRNYDNNAQLYLARKFYNCAFMWFNCAMAVYAQHKQFARN